jgi:hypothetical protein
VDDELAFTEPVTAAIHNDPFGGVLTGGEPRTSCKILH